MQRLVKCCLRAALSSTVLELPAKGSRAPRAVCGYDVLIRRFTARSYSATAGDALTCPYKKEVNLAVLAEIPNQFQI
jgi:hypothetical protein